MLSAVGYEILFDFTILENGHHFHFTYYEEDELERLNKLLLGIFFFNESWVILITMLKRPILLCNFWSLRVSFIRITTPEPFETTDLMEFRGQW